MRKRTKKSEKNANKPRGRSSKKRNERHSSSKGVKKKQTNEKGRNRAKTPPTTDITDQARRATCDNRRIARGKHVAPICKGTELRANETVEISRHKRDVH